MTKEDATNFPYRLKCWWESSSPSSERLEAIARKVKASDDQISHLPLADEMGKSLNLRKDRTQKSIECPYFLNLQD